MRRALRIVGWTALFTVGAVIMSPVVAVVGLVAYTFFDAERASRHPHHADAQAALSAPVRPDGLVVVDLARIAEGEWDVACILGGYSQPDLALAPFSTEADRLASYSVHENEAAIATVREGGISYVRRLFPPVNLQEFRCCTPRTRAKVVLGRTAEEFYSATGPKCPAA